MVYPQGQRKDSLQDLTVYLSDFAFEWFESLYEITGKCEWCFPARNKLGHICVKSISNQIGDRQCMFKKDKNGTPRRPMKNRKHDNTLVLTGGINGNWTPNDLRRTGATMMQSLGIPLETIDHCQNHVLPGSKVRRHYLHHPYAIEKKDAWRRLGECISLVVRPESIAAVMHPSYPVGNSRGLAHPEAAVTAADAFRDAVGRDDVGTDAGPGIVALDQLATEVEVDEENRRTMKRVWSAFCANGEKAAVHKANIAEDAEINRQLIQKHSRAA